MRISNTPLPRLTCGAAGSSSTRFCAEPSHSMMRTFLFSSRRSKAEYTVFRRTCRNLLGTLFRRCLSLTLCVASPFEISGIIPGFSFDSPGLCHPIPISFIVTGRTERVIPRYLSVQYRPSMAAHVLDEHVLAIVEDTMGYPRHVIARAVQTHRRNALTVAYHLLRDSVQQLDLSVTDSGPERYFTIFCFLVVSNCRY